MQDTINLRRYGGQDPFYELEKISIERFEMLTEEIESLSLKSFEEMVSESGELVLEKVAADQPEQPGHI